MKNRAYPYLPLALFGLVLLVALPVSAQEISRGGNPSAALDLASLTKAACHGNVSCQPTYGACAGWSGYSDCGDATCGFLPGCGEEICDEWGRCILVGGPAWIQQQERFRVCFDQYANPCTEWQTIWTSSCGCE